MPRRIRVAGLVLIFLTALSACMRTDGRNSNCIWPGEIPLQAPTPAHISADAEFAEDLAIRYGDVHYGQRTSGWVNGQVYGNAIRDCQGKLNQEIAKLHSVTVSQIENSIGKNRGHLDAAIHGSYIALYCILAFGAAGLIWRKYSPTEHGWLAGGVMAAFLTIPMAIGSTMVGEMWSWLAEGYRVGNEHMTYRVHRLWWVRHRGEMFAISALIFALAVLGTGLRARRALKRFNPS